MKAIFNKAPLTTNTLSSLSLGAIRPEGWLRAQMEAQAKGITGKLREIWPDVGNGSGFENGGQGALMPQIVDARHTIWTDWFHSRGDWTTSS